MFRISTNYSEISFQGFLKEFGYVKEWKGGGGCLGLRIGASIQIMERNEEPEVKDHHWDN